jgi:hypothetical protein
VFSAINRAHTSGPERFENPISVSDDFAHKVRRLNRFGDSLRRAQNVLVRDAEGIGTGRIVGGVHESDPDVFGFGVLFRGRYVARIAVSVSRPSLNLLWFSVRSKVFATGASRRIPCELERLHR